MDEAATKEELRPVKAALVRPILPHLSQVQADMQQTC